MSKGNKIGVRILKRIFLLVVVMFILSVAVFWLARLAPGDPLQSFYGDSLEMMTSEEIDAARTRLGLDQGIAVQYVKWITNALHGDFGLSLKYRQPVLDVIKPLIGNTLLCSPYPRWHGRRCRSHARWPIACRIRSVPPARPAA